MGKGRQASNKLYSKCSENSRSQIVFRTDIFRKLTLGVPDNKKLISTYQVLTNVLRFLENFPSLGSSGGSSLMTRDNTSNSVVQFLYGNSPVASST